MKLLELSVARMPGIDQRISIRELDPRFNIVFGANASGKSSMCRAAQALLWPATYPRDSFWEVYSRWTERDTSGPESAYAADLNALIEISIRGQEHAVRQFGAVREPLPVPADTLRKCYLIALEDLFISDGSDLAALMVNEMAGGFDIQAVMENPPIATRRVSNELKQLKHAQATYKNIEDQQKSLKHSEGRLSELKQKLHQLQERAELKGLIQDAIKARHLLQDAEEKTQHLGGYPDGLDNLHGNELAELTEIEDEIGNLEQREASARKDIIAAESLLTSQKLPPEGISDTDLEILLALVSKLDPLDAELSQLKKTRTALEQELTLGPLANSSQLVADLDFRSAELQTLSSCAFGLEKALTTEAKLLSEQTFLEQRLNENLLGEHSSDDYTAATTAIYRLIEQHLELSGKKISRVTFASLLVLCVVSLAGGYLLHPILYSAMALGLLFFWVLWQPFSAARARLKSLIEQSSCHPILSKFAVDMTDSPAQLSQAAAEIDRERATLLNREERRRADEERYQVLKNDLGEAKRNREDLETQCQALADALGIHCDKNAFSISEISRELGARSDKLRDFREISSAFEARRKETGEILQSLSERLEQYGYSPSQSIEEARACVKDMQRRDARHREAQVLRSRASATLEEAQRQLERYSAKCAEIYQRACLPRGARSELEARVFMLQEYNETKRAVEKNRGNIELLTEKLSGRAAHLLTRSLLELETEEDEAERALHESRELRDTIVRIETDISATRAGRSLEEAAEILDAAEDQLKEAAITNAKSDLCALLLRQVRAEHLKRNRPKVFTESSRLFSQFTHGRYTLSHITTVGRGSAFEVHDSQQGASLELSQLSSGTKAQILLACKVAFAQSLERGNPLPLLLDEALSTSDPIRFEAVIDGLCSLAQEGRQILYFTSQTNDTQAIKEICEQHSCSVSLHTLSPEIESSDSPLLASSAMLEPIPRPEDRPYDEYVKLLRIEPLSLLKGISSIHIAHLTDDTDLLYSLLEMRITTFGQLRSLCESDSASTYISPEAYQRIAARHRLIASSFEQWKIGRGEPLTPEIIQEALPKTKLRDNIMEIFRETRDNNLFLDSIDPSKGKAVPRFTSSHFERLKEALVERGNFSEAPPLSQEEFHRNVLNEVASEVQSGILKASEVARMSRTLWEKLSKAELS